MKSMNFTRLQDFKSNKTLNFTVTAIKTPNYSASLKFPSNLDNDKRLSPHFELSVEICESRECESPERQVARPGQ